MKKRNVIIGIAVLLIGLQLARAATVLLLTLAFGLTVPAQAILSMLAMLLMMGFVLLLAAAQGIKLHIWPQRRNRKTTVLYIAGTAVALALIFLMVFVLDKYSIRSLVTALYFGIVIPLYEELLFRGYIWARLENIGMRQRKIGLFTAAAFSLWHLGYWDVALFYSGDSQNAATYLLTRICVSFVLGLLLAYVRYKSKNCYASILVHSALNTLGV